jgi:putative ABC transport system permease protein
MDTLIKDIRYSVRTLLKHPAFSVVAFVTLALGIGANTLIFSVVNALILNPPNFNDPERIVSIWQTSTEKRVEGYVSYLNLQDWRTRAHSFEDIAGYKPSSMDLTENGEAEPVQGMRVTANFFPLLKVRLFRGRDFRAEEDKPEVQRVAILSYEYWQTKFGGNESALTQQITLNGKPHAIIGVLPPNFEFPLSVKDAAIWTTVAGETGNLPERGARILRVVGRLRSGVPIAQAQAEIATIASSLAQEYPQTNRQTTAYLVGAHEQIVGHDIRKALWLLFGAVAFILLIACTNTANLLLVRAGIRQREIALRAALGAGRWHIARQLLTESLLLALLAGAGGLLIAVWGLGAIKFYAADQLPRLNEVHLNVRVLFFTFLISILTGLLFSLVPTLKASRPDVNEVLKTGGKSTTSGLSLRLWRDSLVVSEVALSLILLVGAGLMIKSFEQLINVPPGFDPTNVLTGQVSLTRAIYDKPEERVTYVSQTLEKLKALPGVESAAFVAPMPFSGGNVGSDFTIDGRPQPEPGNEPVASVRSVTSQYFQAIRIPLLKGRYFTELDRRGGIGAAIVNQTLAQRYFPGEDALGKRISHIGANQDEGDPEQWEIVGVVGDVHHSSLIKEAQPEIYLPYRQNSWAWGNFFVRSKTDPRSLTEPFRQQIKLEDKSVPLTKVRLLTEAIAGTVTQSRFYTLLFGIFGAIGLLLTMTGVYGLISYTVSQRTREIGIRIALGATRQSVVRMVLKQGIGLAIVGVAVGLAISFALTRLIAGLLFEVQPTDLTTFLVAAAVLLSAAFLASYFPARRATQVDPLIALRYE